MTSVVEPFQNRDNFAKYQLFYYEPGATVFIQTLRWLYAGQQPIEYHLADLVADGKIQRQYNIDPVQKMTLLGLRDGTVQLNELDLTLLYKLIQNVCGLASPNDQISNLWNSKCALNRQDCLEYYLYTLKTGRNCLAHPGPQIKNLTDANVDEKCEELRILFTAILQKAGDKANVATQEINDVITIVTNDLERIRQDKHAADSVTPSTKEMILRDLKEWYEEQQTNLSDFLHPAERKIDRAAVDFDKFMHKVGDAIAEVSEPICKEVEHVINQISEPLQDGVNELAKGTNHVADQIAKVFGW